MTCRLSTSTTADRRMDLYTEVLIGIAEIGVALLVAVSLPPSRPAR